MGAGTSSKPKEESNFCHIREFTQSRRQPHFESHPSVLLHPDTNGANKKPVNAQPQSTPTGARGVDGGNVFYPSIEEEVEDVDFPYENLVFEGGGSQGNAYIGAIMELERLGHLEKIKRFAGASVGSVTAATLAVGHGSQRLLDVIRNGPHFDKMLDAQCGACSLIPNFMSHMGWHPGKLLYDLMGEIIAEKMGGNSQATFRDLYEKRGIELCVVVTNLSVMMEEYCHVKTTPDLPITAAVRMSASLPGVFYPVKRMYIGRTDLYIDGGLICNYPLHCYDGWWLSMKPEDWFLRRMQNLKDFAKLLTKKERFGTFNEKTLGMIIFSDYDSHVIATNPNHLATPPTLPDTKKARAHRQVEQSRSLNIDQHRVLSDAMSRFLKVLDEHNLDGNDTINIEEFRNAFQNSSVFTTEHARALFGDELTVKQIFDRLDANKDGQIDFMELMALAEDAGFGIQTHHVGLWRQDIKCAGDFLSGVFQALLMSVKKAFIEGEDMNRTVLINTVYVKSLDFDTEEEDLQFLIEQGQRGLRAFLKQRANVKATTEATEASATSEN